MTRVLGLDPGEHIGVALLEVGARQAVPLVLGAWAASEPPASLLARLREHVDHRETVVCVERVEAVHGAARMGSGYATGLCLSNWIGGLLAGFAGADGLRVVTCTAAEWRSALVGSRSPSDAEVKQAVRLRIPNWPAKSNAHQRDAAGCALWAGLARRTT